MKFLFITREALSVDLAWQLKKEGHEVYFFVQNASEKDVGDGFVQKVDQWEPHKDWADVIVFDDIGFAATAERLRAEGKFVVGGTTYTDRLEDDREFGQEELRRAGVPILPSWNFTSFDEAIAFIRQNPDRYVIKPSGSAQNEKELLFVGQEEDGKDVEQVLEHYKQKWASKIKVFLLQKYAQGVEIAVGAFFNGNDFVEPVNINFEHKRLFPNDIGPSTGEMGCYDDQTEVLTSNGWKLFKDVSPDDQICTLNPANNAIEFQKPSGLVSYNHHRKLISIKNRTLDMMVTPDHNMYVESQPDARKHRERFAFVKARDLQSQSRILRTGTWVGEERALFTLPSVSLNHYEGRQVVVHEAKPIEIPMDTWLSFMGIWLSNGSVVGNERNYIVGVAQKKAGRVEAIEELLKSLPFNFAKGEASFTCSSKQLSSYLRQFGQAQAKFVPQFVKDLSPRQIAIFLEWFALGDATMMRNGYRIFYSSSKRLADDLQELLLKVGRLGIVKRRSGRGMIRIEDHDVDASRPQYEVHERVRKLASWIDRRDVSTLDYEGVVYCATVKNHIMYVRRNGKPCWCGNTSMMWSKPNQIFELTLGRMKEQLEASKYVGYIDINCIANIKGVFPLEFTSRFGYPTVSIHMEGVLSEWGTFLSDIAHGKPTQLKCKKGYQVGVVIAVPPFPFEDEKAFRKYSEDATILFKKPNLNGIHIGEVKLEEGDWKLAGRSGYSLVVTGSGMTMQEAMAQAYQSVKNVMLPNMFYRDDIGRRWSRDSDMLFAWGYL